MSTTIDETTLQTVLGECADAIEISDWATASRKIAKADAILAGLASGFTQSGKSVQYRQTLESLRKSVEQARALAAAESGSVAEAYFGRPGNA